ncbi:hypothetical protein ANTRET_LOCUS103 [Anthophora retusa]
MHQSGSHGYLAFKLLHFLYIRGFCTKSARVSISTFLFLSFFSLSLSLSLSLRVSLSFSLSHRVSHAQSLSLSEFLSLSESLTLRVSLSLSESLTLRISLSDLSGYERLSINLSNVFFFFLFAFLCSSLLIRYAAKRTKSR